MSAEQSRRLLKQVAARNGFMLASLQAAYCAQGIKTARRLQRRYLRSFTARLAAACDVWPKANRGVADLGDDEIADLVHFAKAIDCWKLSKQRAFAWPKPKRGGESYRLVHSLAGRQRAVDKLAARAAAALMPAMPNQFNQQRKGMRKLDEWLQATLPSVQLVLTVDIPSCFDVIRRSSLADTLPLPKQVMKVGLFNLKDRARRLPGILEGVTYKNPYDVGTSSEKRGVPQGSALAQLASEIEIDKLLRAVETVDPSVFAAAYGDNVIILLTDASWLGSVQSALASATTKIFGPDVKSELVHRIRRWKTDHFCFCRRVYDFRKGKLRKDLPKEYLDDFALRATVAIADAWDERSDKALARCERSVLGFLRQNEALRGAFYECIGLLCDIREYRRSLARKSLHAAP